MGQNRTQYVYIFWQIFIQLRVWCTYDGDADDKDGDDSDINDNDDDNYEVKPGVLLTPGKVLLRSKWRSGNRM